MNGIPVRARNERSWNGPTTVRGFEQNDLGAQTAEGDPLDGQAVAVLNRELRFLIWKRLHGGVFRWSPRACAPTPATPPSSSSGGTLLGAKTGAVTAVQRTSADLRLNPLLAVIDTASVSR